MTSSLIWGSPDWLLPAAILAVVALVVLLWAYRRAPSTPAVRTVAGTLKVLGLAALVLCLIEPLFNGTRPRPGANLFVVLADNSQSLKIRDRGAPKTRGELLRERLSEESEWQTRLSQDFDVRRYSFDSRLRSVVDFSALSLDGVGSSLVTALKTITRRYRGRPLAGVLLFTDGNATDVTPDEVAWTDTPPVYPVAIGEDRPDSDISLERVTVSQTNFETAPVTIRAEITTRGYEGEEIVTRLFDASDKELQRKSMGAAEDGRPLVVSFQLRPEHAGVSFYRLRASASSEPEDTETAVPSQEATLANNDRMVVVDRGGGPYRVLYVSGRPNWEFKFLRRALEEDGEVELVGLIRIARREPKFKYRGRVGESTNPLFRGFGNEDTEDAERYDQPVLLRLGTKDDEELRSGFPTAADQLYRYHAVIVDDLEAEYFTHDQMALLQKFVSRRGGGFLMLGGGESFAKGKYARTPIGELLPVYLDRVPAAVPGEGYRLSLTREGWLEPWVRLRATEGDERQRLGAMPMFQTLNPVRNVKPGAEVLAQVTDANGTDLPALVAQRFGKGRAGALLIGDLWRWGLRRKTEDQPDLERAWRQTLRWLVADVPSRIELDVRRKPDDPSLAVALEVRVSDAEYEPLDNASVAVKITPPDGKVLELTASSSDREAGVYGTTYVPRQSGAYRVRVAVTAPDGSAVGEKEAGWTEEGAAAEFRALESNRALLEQIARGTGGELVAADGMERFVRSLPNRKIPITEAWIYPLWHQWWMFLFAVVCLTGEWGLRRWKGLP